MKFQFQHQRTSACVWIMGALDFFCAIADRARSLVGQNVKRTCINSQKTCTIGPTFYFPSQPIGVDSCIPCIQDYTLAPGIRVEIESGPDNFSIQGIPLSSMRWRLIAVFPGHEDSWLCVFQLRACHSGRTQISDQSLPLLSSPIPRTIFGRTETKNSPNLQQK